MTDSQHEIRKKPQRDVVMMCCPAETKETGPDLPLLTGDARPRATHFAWTTARGTMRSILVNMLLFILILLAFSQVWLPKLIEGIK